MPRNKSDKAALSALLDQLEQLGFYRYVDPAQASDARASALEYGYLYGDTGRAFHADAEELAEGGVLYFVREIQPFLAGQRVILTSMSDDFESGGGYGGYHVEINGLRREMYSVEELSSGEIWSLTTFRAFALINELLAQAESLERVYGLDGGNDLFAIFLTPAMYELITARPIFPDSEKPYAVEPFLAQEN
jgi:hypothetical protein